MNHNCAMCEECPFDQVNLPTDIHEIHVTVAGGADKWFMEVCARCDIKSIVVAYDGRDGGEKLDPMTSQTFRGTADEAGAEARRIAHLLENYGFAILRTKIETTPNSPLVHETDGYFESHLSCKVPVDREDEFRDHVANCTFSDGCRGHVSRNAFKHIGDEKTIMVTHRRSNVSSDDFAAETDNLAAAIRQQGYKVDKRIVEYCWMDDKVGHDDEWMRG